MKKKLLIILLAIISVIACVFGLTACNVGDGGDNSGGGSTSLSGTYYLYEDGKLDKSQYITFNGSKWSDDDSVNGTFTLDGTKIVFYAEVMGSKEEMFSGTLSDGKLSVKVLGSTMTYYKEGSEPNGSIGGNDTPIGHTHTWDKTWSSDDEYHWYACSGCNEKKDAAQHYYVDGKCVCGRENNNQGNTPTNKEFEVTFNLNYTGATSVTRSTEDKLITYIPARSGYEFNGWYLDSELMHYFDTAEQVTANGLVLYACWVEEATEIGQLSAPVINVVNNVFSWKSIAGATGYRVIVSASASKTDLVDETVRTTNWTFPISFDAGVYAVKIRAIGDGITTVNSVYSSRNFSLRVLNAVTGIALDRATSLLTWNEVENAEEYNVYVGSKLVSTQTEISFDMSNFDAGSLNIKITATKENWLTSQGSANLSKMRLKTPEVIVSVDPTTNSYILKWDSVKYADTYVLKYGEKEVEIKTTNYTIDINSVVWGGNNTATFTIDAFDSKADYLISAGSKNITINKIYSLNIEKSIEDAGSTALEGNVWQSITVSFNLNGASGSVASQTVTTTKGLTYPSIPTRSGYIFRGWFTEKSCENLYDFTAAIKNNLTLYAGWQSYSGTFIELNSGSKSYSSSTSYKYYYFRALSDTQIRIGYSQTSSSPTSYLMIYDVTKGSVWTDDQSFRNTTPGTTNFYPTAGHVYYIRTHSSTSTTLNLSVYTYPSDGFLPSDGGKAIADYVIGTSSNAVTNCVLYNNEYTLTATTKSGYTWAGWFDGDTKLTSELTYTFTMLAKDVTYTAKWIKVTVDRNNTSAGSVSSLASTYKVGDEATITASTYSGYTFVGWYNGETKLTDDLSYTFTMPSENVTYIAKWIKVTISKSISAAGSVSSLSDKYKVGDQATITASTNNGYTWLGWYNGDTELTKNLSYAFTMPSEDVTYIAKWTYYTLTTSRNNTSAGTVTSYNNTKITAGEEITITATTKSGYTFVGWYNGETELTKDLSYTFTMPSENITCTAKWIKVTVDRNNASAGSVSSFTDIYKVGDEVTVTATTNSGYTWLGWYNGETELTKDLSYTFTMPSEDVTYIAKWTYYTVTTSRNNTSAGTVTSYSNKKFTVGDKVTITATTNSGYVFVGWYNGETELAKDLSYTFIMPSENATYTAKWIKCPVTIQKNISDAGSISGLESSILGKDVTLTATTNNGYTWLGWFDGEIELTKELDYTFTMSSENASYTAKWTYYTLTTSRNNTSAGTVTSYNNTKITAGDEVTVIATTNVGYTFVGWYNGETKLTADLSYTFIMPTENVTYSAKWVKVTLSRSSTSAGSITSLNDKYKAGDEVTVLATTNIGYSFVGWYNGETKLTTDLSYTFIMPTENVTYSAKWEIKEEMQNFNFTSTPTTCIINGLKDKTITTIIVPKYVTEINAGAFSGCSKLESITIPFVGNSSKTSDDTNQYPLGYLFGTSSYSGGTATRQYYYGNSLSSTTNIIYYIPSTLVSVTITDGCENMLSGAFYNCQNLTSITIPKSVNYIGDNAFYGCNALTIYCEAGSKPSGWDSTWNSSAPVVWNYKNNEIADNGYVYTVIDGIRYSLKGENAIVAGQVIKTSGNIIIPETIVYKAVTYNVVSIDNNAFSGCSGLTSITIPNSVIYIGSNVFSKCSKLESITIPFIGDSVKTSDDTNQYPLGYLFGTSSYSGGTATRQYYYGKSLNSTTNTTYYIPSTLVSVTITDGCENILSGAFYNCQNLTSITIPKSVNYIGDNAFYGCSCLTNITIPQSVTFIGESAFKECNGLTIYCEAGSKPSGWKSTWNSSAPVVWNCKNKETDNSGYIYAIIDGIRYSLKNGSAEVVEQPTNITVAKIPTKVTYKNNEYSVTSIKRYAFKNCKKLTSVSVPNSVTSIGEGAFYSCSSLTSVTLSSAITVIRNETFYYCSSLTSITIPNGVININSYAFKGCGITSITLPDSVTYIATYAFENCSKLTKVTIPASVTTIGKYAFTGCSNLSSAIFKDINGWAINTTGTLPVIDMMISSSSLANSTTAAKYLKTDYVSYYWLK